MVKKALVLAGSPRRNGNSNRLADAFIEGAVAAGHDVEKLSVRDLDVAGCLGCNACRRNGGECVQKDDMADVYTKVMASDVIALAFPVYFYSWNAQLKTVLDRLYAIESKLTDTEFYLLASCAAPSMEYEQPVLDGFRNYISCFRAGGNREGGYVFAFNAMRPKDSEGGEAVERARELGRGI